jgi:adenosylcobinamide-phosphate synthase
LKAFWYLHPLAGLSGAIIISSTCLATRSLHVESDRVATALSSGDLPTARHYLSWIVGRDTDRLEEPEIWRALVETVSENTSDGIIAPMFWLALGGPVAAMAYKAVSTLDSMVGDKNGRYLHLGRASARMDDLLNFIPARLTALLIIIAAALIGLSAHDAMLITLRDRLKHPSPNSGHPEAAAAGALGVRLGGAASYDGVISWKEQIGNSHLPLDEQAYRSMIKLMYISTILMAAACISVAFLLRGIRVPFL